MFPDCSFYFILKLLNYSLLLFVSKTETCLLDWNIVNVRRCAPIRESVARFGYVPADRHQATLVRVNRYLASWVFAHQLYENRKYLSYVWHMKSHPQHRQSWIASTKNRFNVREESYFSLPFRRKMEEKSVAIFPRLFDEKGVQRASALYDVACEKGRGGRKFHRCLNSIAISLEKIQLKTEWNDGPGETMFTSRWRSDGSLWRNWRKEKKKKEMVQWDEEILRLTCLLSNVAAIFFFFFPSLLSRGLCDNIHQNHRIILAGNNEISVKFSKLKSAICDEIT